MRNYGLLFQTNWYHVNFILSKDLSITWIAFRIGRALIGYLIRYTFYILVPTFRFTSVFGLSLLINMCTQMWSGFMLALYYVPDPSLVITYREEYMNEIWWFFYVYKTHVVGVDSIFILSYLHILKKIFIKNFIGVEVEGWTTGTYAFLVYHAVVFLGITLSTNHLGDLTLTIGASIFWSLFLNKHKIATLLFTNKHLNVDQLIRFMVAHYLVAWYYIYLVQSHVMYIHECWDPDSASSANQDGSSPKGNWILDALPKEGMMMLAAYITSMWYCLKSSHPDLKPVNFNFFEQWSEAEMEDLNFFIVGPHWYFRPHMGLLTICAQHYEGLFWLGSYYIILAFMPTWSSIFLTRDLTKDPKNDCTPIKECYLQLTFFTVFVLSLLYVGGTLPCARFYYEEDEGFFGNSLLRLSYQYIYLYLFFLIHFLDRLSLTFKGFFSLFAVRAPRRVNSKAKTRIK